MKDERENAEKSPEPAERQEAPEPERLVTPQEEEGQSVQEMEEPPQAEGDRE